MSFSKNRMPGRVLFSILAVIVFLMACTCEPTAWLAAPSPTATRTGLPPTRGVDVTPTGETPIRPSDSPPGETGLIAEAPWLIVSTSDGLWAANQDGANLVPLVPKTYPQIDLHTALQPGGRHIAVVLSGPDYYHGLSLNLISLPEGTLQKITDLTTAESEPAPDAMPGEPVLEAMRAISEQPSIAWSADGSKLAFIGALDGPKADVYVYDMGTQDIRKISDDAAQDFSPSWSPDGQFIVYLSAEVFGTGAGVSIKGVWMGAADGSGAALLEDPHTDGEEIIGWRDASTVVLVSWTQGEGRHRSRMVDIRTKKIAVLQPGVVTGVAVSGGMDAGTIFFNKDDGLYLLAAGASQPKRIAGGKLDPVDYAAPIRWCDEGRMFVVRFEDGSLSTFLPDGTERQDAPFNPSSGISGVSSFGLIWGWTNAGGEMEGAWISGPGLTTTRVFSGPALAPNWSIDNNLLFFSGPDLYVSRFDNYFSGAAPVSTLTGDVWDAVWMGFREALDNKYG